MTELELQPFAARVRSAQGRQLIIAAIAAAFAVGALCLPDSQAPLTGRIAISLMCFAVTAWVALQAFRAGRCLTALRAGQRVVWFYTLHASINGTHAASGVMVGFESGGLHELLTTAEEAPAVMNLLHAAHPHASMGFDEQKRARFQSDPQSLLQR